MYKDIENGSVGEEGFSLVEILVSLVILSSIGVIVSGFIVQLGQLNQKTEDLIHRQNSLMALNYISKTIAAAQDTPIRFSANGRLHVFGGTPNWLEFSAPVRIRSNTYALRHIKFDHDSQRREVRQHSSQILTNAENEKAESLINRISSRSSKIKFQYKSRDGAWLDNWNKYSILPLAVKIVLHPASAGQQPLETVSTLLNSPPHIINR